VDAVFVQLKIVLISGFFFTVFVASAEQFKSEDDILLKQIQELNQHIYYINSTLGTRTPNFSTDIQHRINTSNKNSKKKARNQYNFQLYKDGIHPTANLAKVWLRKLSYQIKIDCW
jgi:hypothetical protein